MKNRTHSPERNRSRANGSGRPDAERSPGRVFVLAAGGLRCANPGNGGQGCFLGYAPEEIFWRDVLEVVHEDDLGPMWTAIFRIMESPGASECLRVRLWDAAGGWRPVEATVQNVLEVPGDGGLLAVNLRPVAD